MNEIPRPRGFVAYLDMLGLKRAVLRDPAAAWEALVALRRGLDGILRLGIELLTAGERIEDRLRPIFFADTIILFTEREDDADVWSILTLGSQLFWDALNARVPLRGGIAHGELFFDIEQGLLLGTPLVQAYQMAEEAQWLGIVVDGSVAARARALPMLVGDGRPAIVDWGVPVRDGSITARSVVNWPAIFRHGFLRQPPLSAEDMYEPFERLYGTFEEQELAVRQKYQNTAAFVNEQFSLRNG